MNKVPVPERFRPLLLTVAAAMLSSLLVILDPICSGIGWSLIFGLMASTIFTLFAIPVASSLLHGSTSRTDKR